VLTDSRRDAVRRFTNKIVVTTGGTTSMKSRCRGI